jgi:hypothetical protein
MNLPDDYVVVNKLFYEMTPRKMSGEPLESVRILLSVIGDYPFKDFDYVVGELLGFSKQKQKQEN